MNEDTPLYCQTILKLRWSPDDLHNHLICFPAMIARSYRNAALKHLAKQTRTR